jgi:lysophospholipase L1-like esterase
VDHGDGATEGRPQRGIAPGKQAERHPGRLRRAMMAIGGILVVLAGLEFGLRALALVLTEDRLSARTVAEDETEPFTIVCVGDSWTEGARGGRYPDYLFERLTGASPSSGIRLINLGRSGINSSQSLARVAWAMDQHRPDLLLVLTGNNDHHNLTDSNYWRFEDSTLGPAAIMAARFRIFVHSLRVWRLGRTAIQLVKGGPTPNEFFETDPRRSHDGERADLLAIDLETHRRQLVYNLTRIVELARERRVQVVLQTYFHFHGYHVNEVIRDVASDLDVPLVDHNYLFHTLVPAERRESMRIPDGHPNSDGYAFMALQVEDELGRLEFVPR